LFGFLFVLIILITILLLFIEISSVLKVICQRGKRNDRNDQALFSYIFVIKLLKLFLPEKAFLPLTTPSCPENIFNHFSF
jgi:hypothetical protein